MADDNQYIAPPYFLALFKTPKAPPLIASRLADFAHDSDEPRPQHKAWLTASVATVVKANPGCSVDLLGHASMVGDAGYNHNLSIRRMRKIETHLRSVLNGVKFEAYHEVARGVADSGSNARDDSGKYRAVEVVVRQGGGGGGKGGGEVKIQHDFVIQFRGVAKGMASPIKDSEVYDTFALDEYLGLPNRQLVRVGNRTDTIGADFAGTLNNHAQQIAKHHREGTLGAVFIFGSSSGGRNAVDLAGKLESMHVPVAYVASTDAAYFANETQSRPEREGREQSVPPLFGPPEIPSVAAKAVKENYFQTRGNHGVKTFSHGLMFASGINNEIHGRIIGFTNFDLTRMIADSSDDQDAHSKCIGLARPQIFNKITVMFNDLK